jgi:hypothetical protein
MEEADEGEVMILNVVKAGEERPTRCLTDEKEFQAWKKRKGCKRKRRIKTGGYVIECCTEEKEYMLWRNQ